MKWIAGLTLVIATLVVGVMATGSVQDDEGAASASATAPSDAVGNGPGTVLITGANRGLGLEFARQYHAKGWSVIGTARKPEKAEDLNAIGVRVEQLDVADAESVAKLKAALGEQSIDLLINNAGVSGNSRSLASMTIEDVERTIQVNLLGPIRVTQALLDNVRASEGKLIVNITSGLGSITNSFGGIYGYRESKAGLNMFTKSLAADLKEEGFICIVMSPGWVKTDMGGPQANLTPKESITGMIKVIEGLTAEGSGKFWRYNGEQMEW